MIRHVVDIYCAAKTPPILVVTGHGANAVAAALADAEIRKVSNSDYTKGQSTSVMCGLRAPKDARAVLIGLGGQPHLTSDDIQSLLTGHASADPKRISIATISRRRGNQIVVPVALRNRLLEDPQSPDRKTCTRSNPEHVQLHALGSCGCFTNIDTTVADNALIAGTPEETV
ncbi:MAG: NTP transferase domain-containing protein [Rhodobacteraceae bacterium]|jgi:molybdenum cofactor cytidylyltransferase|uniref:nucleotidyltransferase family protein n=1 Tax=Marivita sp. TaxID=2003365 RepID=UPI003B52F582|nr:NTP transferase domain-containing protein [Paracoccaceae bacterium]